MVVKTQGHKVAKFFGLCDLATLRLKRKLNKINNIKNLIK